MKFTTGKPLFDPAHTHRLRNNIERARSEARVKRIEQRNVEEVIDAKLRLLQERRMR